MADHVDYPESPPISCVTDIISIIRSDETATRRDELFHCAWNVQGYLFRTFIGDPDGTKFSALPLADQNAFLGEFKIMLRSIHECDDDCCKDTVYGNDIMDFLDDWGLDSIKNVVAPFLKFLYDLIGRVWKH